MNKRNGLKAALAAAAIIFAAATPALATTVDVGGGTWSYDQGADTAWSNYKHPTKDHQSSVQIENTIHSSGCTAKGKWSLASAKKGKGKPQFFYRSSCS
ncbi:lactococcin 972 family bacteriocin [Streptomyces griseus]|uniref:lactococcin 972 family bacteriocin n=1 Tax=Streptomyces griseus TaxID=1911 RepID=UPI0033CDD290